MKKILYVKITATDQVLKDFCYLPLVSGEVYKATYSKINGVECNTFFDVIFNDEIMVRDMHESRLQILTQEEIREYRINQIIC
jgi:hypothetical protein